MSMFGTKEKSSAQEFIEILDDDDGAPSAETVRLRAMIGTDGTDLSDIAIDEVIEKFVKPVFDRVFFTKSLFMARLGYNASTAWKIPTAEKFKRQRTSKCTPETFLNDPAREVMVMPFNVGMHWEVIIAEKGSRTIFLLDSLQHTNRNEGEDILSVVREAFGEGWVAKSLKNPENKQSDSTSCGVYVILFAERALEKLGNGEPLDFANILQGRTIGEHRKRLAHCLS